MFLAPVGGMLQIMTLPNDRSLLGARRFAQSLVLTGSALALSSATLDVVGR